MAPDAQLFPVSPWDLGHPAPAEPVVRRMLRRAKIDERSKVLDLGCRRGELSFFVAREFGCSVTGVDEDPACLEVLRNSGLQTRQGRFDQIVELAKFDAVLLCRKLVAGFPSAAEAAREQLLPNGHLIIGYPVFAGGFVPANAMQLWRERLGEPLRSPQELLAVLAQLGFEPEALELVEDSILEARYAAHESSGEGSTGSNRSSAVRFAVACARRKDPSEKPPVSPRRR
jgi:SAM-dependent methyltransferase